MLTVLGIVLSVLLFILRIILWLVLGILGLVLVLLLMILFVPFRYRLEASKYADIHAQGRFSYLLRIFRVNFQYTPRGYAYKVKVLFFTVMSEEHFSESPEPVQVEEGPVSSEVVEEMALDDFLELLKEEKAAEEAKDKSKKIVKEPVETPDRKPVPQEKNATEEVPSVKEKEVKVEEVKIEKTEVKVEEPAKKPEPKKERPEQEKRPGTPTQAPKPDRERPEKKEKPENKASEAPKEEQGEKPLQTALRFYRFLKEEENHGVLKFILRRIFRALKSVLPRKFYGKVHFGTDDPAVTGYILGAVSMFYPKYRKSLFVTADFDKPVLEGEVRIQGRIIPGAFVWQAIRIILDRRVRRLIREVRK